MTKSSKSPARFVNWPEGIANLLDEVRVDVEQLRDHGRIERAVTLSQQSGMAFDASYNPMYFTGEFESPVVLVHLNPKLNMQLATTSYENFGDYCVKHRSFGFFHWGLDPSYSSKFDLKQVRFLRPFGVIDFHPELQPWHKRANAAMAIDKKLQLELVPYASESFQTSKFSSELLQPHLERVLSAIVACPRKYVIFCGAVFDDLLQTSEMQIHRKLHQFHLPTKGGPSKGEYYFSNVEFSFNGTAVQAGIARSFAIQGIPMEAYGEECARLYGTDSFPKD